MHRVSGKFKYGAKFKLIWEQLQIKAVSLGKLSEIKMEPNSKLRHVSCQLEMELNSKMRQCAAAVKLNGAKFKFEAV